MRHARRAHGAVALQHALRRAQVGIQLVTRQKGDVYDQNMVISTDFFLWDLVGYSWDIHGIFMGYSWDIHGIFMGYSWDIHGNLFWFAKQGGPQVAHRWQLHNPKQSSMMMGVPSKMPGNPP